MPFFSQKKMKRIMQVKLVLRLMILLVSIMLLLPFVGLRMILKNRVYRVRAHVR